MGGGSDVNGHADAGTLSVHVRLGRVRHRQRRSCLLPTVSQCRHSDRMCLRYVTLCYIAVQRVITVGLCICLVRL